MNTENFDYSQFQSAPQNEAVKKIVEGADKQTELTEKVTVATNDLKKAKTALVTHTQITMPNLMKEASLEEFTTDGGIKISIKDEIRASVPADADPDRKKEAYKWLEDNGEAKLIKSTFTIEVDAGDGGEVSKIGELLNQNEIEFEYKRTHNPNSLKSVIKGKMEAGIDVPQKVFGVFKQKFCKILKGKKKK